MRLPAALLAVQLLLPGTVEAADPVTIVRYPLMNRPLFYRTGAGESFTIECAYPQDASGWKVSLNLVYLDEPVALEIVSRTFSADKRQHVTVKAADPGALIAELYDLVVTSPAGVTDTVRNAVRVIPDFTSSFTFVHLPDCHLPACAWLGEYDDPNTAGEVRAVLKEINLLNPAFILQTGDIVDNGEIASQYELAQDILEASEVPVFLTGGNHDLWKNGHENWHTYFGSTMDYSFMYDDVRFLGLEMYNDPVSTYTPAQMTWLQSELTASLTSAESGRVIFTHFDESGQLTPDFTDTYSIEAVIYGHSHQNMVSTTGTEETLKLNTSYTMNDNGNYRLIHMSGGEITSHQLLEFGKLFVTISPVNDGSALKVQAEITNDHNFALTGLLVKLHIKNDGVITPSGGEVMQFLDYGQGGGKRVYYLLCDVPAGGTRTVSLESSALTSEPPLITAAYPGDNISMFSGRSLDFGLVTEDEDTDAAGLAYDWFVDGDHVQGADDSTFTYGPPMANSSRTAAVRAEVTDGSGNKAVHEWTVFVRRSSGVPVLTSDIQGFFKYDQQIELSWLEPVSGAGRLEFGRQPGQYSGFVPEAGQTNTVTFYPEDAGMGLGIYFCRIVSGGLAGKEFGLLLESPDAPVVIGPVGNITTLDPVFAWEAVQGVPYYSLILSNTEIKVSENSETGEYEVEGANPIWGVLTSETRVQYGDPDPSGTMPNFPPPLVKGRSYWWAVLNCYGDSPKWTSTVLAGINQFKIDMPASSMQPPVLRLPAAGDTLQEPVITFTWDAVAGASGYNFYPFKIEIEQGIAVRRPIWNEILTTNNTYIEFDAANRMVHSEYRWIVAAWEEDGSEKQSDERRFFYQAPEAEMDLVTWDSKGTAAQNDDERLDRVDVSVEALQGVDMGLPLFTDDSGRYSGLTLTPGLYIFSARKDGYAPVVDTLRLAENSKTVRNFRLAPDPSFISGRVVDQQGGAVSAASVTAHHGLHADIRRSVKTNTNGAFSLSVMPGPWVVRAEKTGHQASAPRSVSVVSDSSSRLAEPILLRRNENVISGTVINTADQPVYGASVTLTSGGTSLKTATNANGRFTFSVFDGTWTVSAQKSGFSGAAARRLPAVSGGQSYKVEPDLELDPVSSMLMGTVTDGFKSISGALVKAVPAAGQVVTVTTDMYGQFSLTLVPGEYRLSAEKAGYTSDEPFSAAVGPGESVSGIKLGVRASQGSISGAVTVDGFTPLPGAVISLNGRQTETNSSGGYSLAVSPGSGTVSAAMTGYLSPSPRTVTVQPGQNLKNIDFTMAPNASVISGRVVSSAGVGVAACGIYCTNGLSVTTRTGEDGRFELNVEAGTHTIRAEKQGFLSDSTEITIGQGQTAALGNLILTPDRAVLQGTVRDSARAAAVSGATIAVESAGVRTRSRHDGSFTVSLPPDPDGHLLSVQADGYKEKLIQTPALDAVESLTVPVLLQAFTATVSGTVYDQSGGALAGAEVSVTVGQDTFLTVTSTDGRYLLGLGGIFGPAVLRAAKRGYAPAETAVTLSEGQRLSGEDLTLQARFSRISGRITDAGTGAAVSQANVYLFTGQDLTAVTGTGENGDYDFISDRGEPYLPAASYTLVARKSGFISDTLTAVVLAENSSRTEDLSLTRLSGFLRGRVTDFTDASVENAHVTTVSVSTGERYSAASGPAGAFSIDGLVPGTYRMTVSRTGYTSFVDDTVSTSVDTLHLQISRNRGRFRGRVTNSETGEGLAAAVTMQDTSGNQLQITAAGSGYYDSGLHRMLPAAPTDSAGEYFYRLHVSRGGFVSADTTVSALKDTAVNFSLKPIYGSISGTVLSSGDSAAVGGCAVRASGGGIVYHDTTGAAGAFAFSRLPAGTYLVSAGKSGFIPPKPETVSLRNDGDALNVDFMAEAAVISSIVISGPTRIANTAGANFSFTAKTADERRVTMDPFWSVDIAPALKSESRIEDGYIVPKPDFIGPLYIYCADNTGRIDSLKVSVYADIFNGGASDTLDDYRGAQFIFPEDCVQDEVLQFSLTYPQPPPAKKKLPGYDLSGRVYALQPAYQTLLSREITLMLPLPQSGTSDAVMAWWNPGALRWETVENAQLAEKSVLAKILRTAAAGSGLTVQTDMLAEWAVFTGSLSLGLREYSASPNPFSPEWGDGLRISFLLSSDEADQVFLSASVYSVTGDIVRVLKEREPYPKNERVELVWDGYTDNGATALNGRYILFFEIRDGHKTKKILKTAVLVK